LADQGNTVVVIEHNLDVVKTADWIVDFGPKAATAAGEIRGLRSPEQVAAKPEELDGSYLDELLNGTANGAEQRVKALASA